MSSITSYHAKYFAHYLTRRLPANDLGKLTASLHDAQVIYYIDNPSLCYLLADGKPEMDVTSSKILQKLEITWIGKDEKREAIEPCILIEDPK